LSGCFADCSSIVDLKLSSFCVCTECSQVNDKCPCRSSRSRCRDCKGRQIFGEIFPKFRPTLYKIFHDKYKLLPPPGMQADLSGDHGPLGYDTNTSLVNSAFGSPTDSRSAAMFFDDAAVGAAYGTGAPSSMPPALAMASAAGAAGGWTSVTFSGGPVVDLSQAAAALVVAAANDEQAVTLVAKSDSLDEADLNVFDQQQQQQQQQQQRAFVEDELHRFFTACENRDARTVEQVCASLQKNI
jgi:hypothetical protein